MFDVRFHHHTSTFPMRNRLYYLFIVSLSLMVFVTIVIRNATSTEKTNPILDVDTSRYGFSFAKKEEKSINGCLKMTERNSK